MILAVTSPRLIETAFERQIKYDPRMTASRSFDFVGPSLEDRHMQFNAGVDGGSYQVLTFKAGKSSGKSIVVYKLCQGEISDMNLLYAGIR
jgi:hypothetical protein